MPEIPPLDRECPPFEALERRLLAARLHHANLRKVILVAYGGKCSSCGCSDWLVLQLDHIHGGGNQHRKALGTTLRIYEAVIREGCPKDKYRLLCANCNVKAHYYRTHPGIED